MDLLFLFCLVFAMSLCASVYMCSVVTSGKGPTSWLSFVVFTVSLSLSHWYPGSVWYLIVSIPDLCTLTYLVPHAGNVQNMKFYNFARISYFVYSPLI